jgi:hypothetical protein
MKTTTSFILTILSFCLIVSCTLSKSSRKLQRYAKQEFKNIEKQDKKEKKYCAWQYKIEWKEWNKNREQNLKERELEEKRNGYEHTDSISVIVEATQTERCRKGDLFGILDDIDSLCVTYKEECGNTIIFNNVVYTKEKIIIGIGRKDAMNVTGYIYDFHTGSYNYDEKQDKYDCKYTYMMYVPKNLEQDDNIYFYPVRKKEKQPIYPSFTRHYKDFDWKNIIHSHTPIPNYITD